ncbi:hypothetical protein FRC06_003752 [Ceratobasidium sp. 370]|nr:hypothetical protein FRC06_003752 [Ceratobasidium sp. 370]
MSIPSLQHLVLEKLQLEASQPIDVAISVFSNLPPPPDEQFVSLSDSNPEILLSPDVFEESFSLFLALPTPSPSQLADIRVLLTKAATCDPGSLPRSLCIACADRQVHVPTRVVQVWPCIHTLIRLSLAWVKIINNLISLSDSSTPSGSLASKLLDQMTTLSLDSPVPNSHLRHLRTSDLPILIQDAWLSDDHINAGVELINWHPERAQGVYALNSYFVDYLRRQFERSATYPATCMTKLDRLITSLDVNELLIPLHLPSHWVLLHINIPLRCYSYTDTLNLGERSAPPVTIDLINHWLSSLLDLPIVLTSSSRQFGVGAQLDSSSCGVAVMSTMAYYALGGLHCVWTQAATMEHRLVWAICFTSTVEGLDLPVLDIFLEDLDDDSYPDSHSDSIGSELENPPSYHVHRSRSKNLKQTTLPFKSIPRDEHYFAQETRRYLDSLAGREVRLAHLEHLDAQRKAEKRERDRNRKREKRARQKKARQEAEAARRDGLTTQLYKCYFFSPKSAKA